MEIPRTAGAPFTDSVELYLFFSTISCQTWPERMKFHYMKSMKVVKIFDALSLGAHYANQFVGTSGRFWSHLTQFRIRFLVRNVNLLNTLSVNDWCITTSLFCCTNCRPRVVHITHCHSSFTWWWYLNPGWVPCSQSSPLSICCLLVLWLSAGSDCLRFVPFALNS